MNTITLTLSLEEVNTLLNALGTEPYVQVHQLIAKIQTQGNTQLHTEQNGLAKDPERATIVTEEPFAAKQLASTN